jgi:hypothetical protein
VYDFTVVDDPQVGRYKRLFQHTAWSFVSFVVPFLADTAMSSIVVLGMMWFLWLTGLAKTYGLSQEDADAFGNLHLWVNFGIFGSLGIATLVRVIRLLIRTGGEEKDAPKTRSTIRR